MASEQRMKMKSFAGFLQPRYQEFQFFDIGIHLLHLKSKDTLRGNSTKHTALHLTNASRIQNLSCSLCSLSSSYDGRKNIQQKFAVVGFPDFG
jgi:hypothetical protein